MKYKLLALAILILTCGPLYGQNCSVGQTCSGTLSATDAGTCATANACLLIPMPTDAATVVIQLSGTFTGTVQFEETADGANWVSANGTAVGSTTQATSATATGAWRFPAAGAAAFRSRCSALGSGSVTVQMTTSKGSPAAGGSGSVTAVTGTANQITSTGGAAPVLALANPLTIPGQTVITQPTGNVVALTATGDSNAGHPHILDINLAGGSAGNGFNVDYLGNTVAAGTITSGGGAGGGQIVLNGATSGSTTLSVTATGGTLNLGSANATVTGAGALTVASCTGCGGSGSVLLNPAGAQTIQSTTADSSFIVTQFNGTNSTDIFQINTKTPTNMMKVTSAGKVQIGQFQVDPVNTPALFSNITNTQSSTYSGGIDTNGAGGATLGSGTFRGADSTGSANNDNGGSATLRGGDISNTGTATSGAVTVRAGNCKSTTGTCTSGATNLTGGGFTAAFTNGVGGDVTIGGGLGTGNATPSHVIITEPTFGLASGTTAQTAVQKWIIHTKAGSTTSATATNMFNVALPSNTAAGLVVIVNVTLISSTPNICSTTEYFGITETNNNGAFGTANVTAGTITTLCSAGTLTLAMGATGANPSVISVTPTWGTITSITSATITVEIHNLSPFANTIALL